jgi:hypothetical protein
LNIFVQQGDLPNGKEVVSIGRGFVLLEKDYDAIVAAVQALMNPEAISSEAGTKCQAIGQMFRVSLFPGNTASYGYYSRGKGSQFHLERYERMTSKIKLHIFPF